MFDPVSDIFTKLKNSLTRRKDTVDMQYSKLKAEISRVLVSEGFLAKQETLTKGAKKILRITLKYGVDKFGKPSKPVITELVQVSKPGRRVYSGARELSRVQSGFGISIISTPLGLLEGEQARKKKVGGEVIGYIY
ncbi:30S ribosomal protein S8 [Candidatus Saganbacteria bacterium]|nr:30S ribosomal protein S8 [Candidatus Saganbacteria bacterium]